MNIVVSNSFNPAPFSMTSKMAGAIYKLIKFKITPNKAKRIAVKMTFFSFCLQASLIINHEF